MVCITELFAIACIVVVMYLNVLLARLIKKVRCLCRVIVYITDLFKIACCIVVVMYKKVVLARLMK